MKDKLQEVLVKELPNPELDLKDRIKDSIGITDLNFAKTNPDCVERFQVLSPVINPVWGTYQLNTNFQEWVGNTNRKLSVEIAPNFIFYGDKVIQLLNEKEIAILLKKKSNCQMGKLVLFPMLIIKIKGHPSFSQEYLMRHLCTFHRKQTRRLL